MDCDDSAWGQARLSPHPDVQAATEAIRGALNTLAREPLTVNPPDPAALRDMSCRPGDVTGVLGGCILATLAAPDPAPGGLQRGGSRASEDVRGPRPAEKRPGA